MGVFDDTMKINLRSVIDLTRLCIPHLISSKGKLFESNFSKFLLIILLTLGNVVNVSSISGLKGSKAHLSYNISKAGLNMFTMSSAIEFADRGVRFNAVK